MKLEVNISKKHLIFIFALFLVGTVYAVVSHSAADVFLADGTTSVQSSIGDLETSKNQLVGAVDNLMMDYYAGGAATVTAVDLKGTEYCWFFVNWDNKIILPTNGAQCTGKNCQVSPARSTMTVEKCHTDMKNAIDAELAQAKYKITYGGKQWSPYRVSYNKIMTTWQQMNVIGATFGIRYSAIAIS
jgi:hypothetical protein